MSGAWLEGRVRRVLWASPESGYAVVRIESGDEEVTAVGILGPLADDPEGLVDSFVALEGDWESHAVHGRQFRASGFLQGLPRTLTGLELYLSSAGIKGIGRSLAARIVERFGVSALAVLEESPERLTEVAGIGSKRAKAIAERWAADEAGRAFAVTLRGLGLPARLVEKIRRRYGDQASHVVHREPYRLAEDVPGVGFRTADRLASELGMPEDDPARVRAACLHALRSAEQDGHCYLPADELTRRVAALDVPTASVPDALAALVADRRIHRDDECFYVPERFIEEVRVAAGLARRLEAEREIDGSLVARAAQLEGVALDEKQTQAVERALAGGLVVVTGGPGTGKTTLVKVIVRAARLIGEVWRLASPTGRAARRMEEATGTDASTLHRLLEYSPGEGGFQRGPSNPIEGDGLVVDEVSMVDLPLLDALVEALPAPPFPVVLVGDADQLPSVGPGAILADLIDSGRVDVVRLERIYRQGARSGIVVAASEILGGRLPESGERAEWDDFFLVHRDTPDSARVTLTDSILPRLEALGFSLADDVQVLTPMRKGPLGTEALNELLQAHINPHGASLGPRGRGMRIGDRVLCVRNRYDVEVFNGDVGRVTAKLATGIAVAFSGRDVEWAWEDLGMLDLAYAVTIHKSQGSEYAAVVAVLARGHHVMLRRNLFYTAVTRARRFLCVLGDRSAWSRAVSEARTERRYTALAGRLLRVCEAPPEDLFGG